MVAFRPPALLALVPGHGHAEGLRGDDPPARHALHPMAGAGIGTVKIEAFYDGAGKYGADDVACTVPVS